MTYTLSVADVAPLLNLNFIFASLYDVRGALASHIHWHFRISGCRQNRFAIRATCHMAEMQNIAFIKIIGVQSVCAFSI